jgi:hypothetical protein
MAKKPLILKNHLASDIRRKLPDVIKKEIAMHAVSFKLPEVV